MNPVAILGLARTPLAPLNGALREVHPDKLGAHALTAAFERSGAAKDALGRVVVGTLLDAGRGPNPARSVVLEAGFGEWERGPSAVAIRAGGASALEALAIAALELEQDRSGVAAAIGVDSASLAPFLLPEARVGSRLGSARLVDGALHDAWSHSDEDLPLAALASVAAQKVGLDRAKFLEGRARSVEKARAAAGKDEIAPLEVHEGKNVKTLATDELAGALAPLPGDEAYAATLADGAAAVVLGPVKTGTPRLLAVARATVESRLAVRAPVDALAALLKKAGKSPRDLAVIEVDESLFVAPELARRELELPEAKVNPRGGAHAYGHVGGACGLRALVTGIAQARAQGGGLVAVSYGAGGGAALAVLVEV